jgi:dTDP-4-dehydrorhamnose reductase
MRLLVTGADGQVGWELSRSLRPLGEVVALGRRACDLSRPEGLPKVIRDANPSVIVNAGAYTAVDRAESEEQRATVVNGAAVGVMAQEARRIGALLVHYSTDYVFDGSKSGPYTEDDPPSPANAYGRSKLAGETAVREAGGMFVILRTSWVYAARRSNFVRTILKLARERDSLRIVADQVGAPTWSRNIADATALIIRSVRERKAEGEDAFGRYNLTASGSVSWHGFAESILEIARRNGLLSAERAVHLDAIATHEYPVAAARPKNSVLSGDRLRQRFGIALPDWRQGLELCLQEMAECAGSAASN